METTALFKLTYGLYLLSTNDNGKDNGCIINTAMQIANNPAKIMVVKILVFFFIIQISFHVVSSLYLYIISTTWNVHEIFLNIKNFYFSKHY